MSAGGKRRFVKLDVDSVRWLETELRRLEYGEVGLFFVVHAGEIVKRRRILEIKENTLTKEDDDA